MAKPQVDVAIAILLHNSQVLVGWREAKQHQGNKYEFPGGKVEVGESAVAACRREVLEEVGVDLEHWHPFAFIQHEYDDVVVNLNIFHAVVSAELLSHIRQPWTWYKRAQLMQLNFPKANLPLLQRLSWAEKVKISAELDSLIQLPSEQWLYWRTELSLDEQLRVLAELSVEQLPRLIVNLELWQAMNSIQQAKIAAIQLKQIQLLQLEQGALQQGQRYIASCHDLASLKHAEHIGCDAVFLSPVQHTPTHPDAQVLGWTQFAELAAQMHIPVFALGGLQQQDLALAQRHHAYGIAGQRFLAE